MKKTKAKELYIKGNSISLIATSLGVSRATIYNYKGADLKSGVDWDELKYIKQTSNISTKDDEKRFLATLIENFENSMLELEDIENPKERLELITKFTNAYFKIKQPNKGDCKGAKASGASDAIYALSQIAIEQNAKSVVAFLGEYHDIIIERVLSSMKS